MARHSIPKVIDDHLTPLDVTGETMPAIMVGSAGWYAWLSDATTRSFAFHSPQGVLTALDRALTLAEPEGLFAPLHR